MSRFLAVDEDEPVPLAAGCVVFFAFETTVSDLFDDEARKPELVLCGGMLAAGRGVK